MNWTRLYCVIMAKDLTVCEVYIFIRHGWWNNVIFQLNYVNRLMGLWIWATHTDFRIPLLSDSTPEKFLASQEPSGPKVTRKLFRQILTKNFHLPLQPIIKIPLDSRSFFFLSKIIYDIGFEWFGPIKDKEKGKKRPNQWKLKARDTTT